jgi:hypothetical protein
VSDSSMLHAMTLASLPVVFETARAEVRSWPRKPSTDEYLSHLSAKVFHMSSSKAMTVVRHCFYARRVCSILFNCNIGRPWKDNTTRYNLVSRCNINFDFSKELLQHDIDMAQQNPYCQAQRNGEVSRLIIIWIVLGISTIHASHADSLSDIASFAQSVCDDVPKGSDARTSIKGKIEANSGVLARIIAGNKGVSGWKAEELYEGIPFDKLPNKFTSTAVCKVELVKLLSDEHLGEYLKTSPGDDPISVFKNQFNAIIDSGYGPLYSLNSERRGYGLYTYALFSPGRRDRVRKFIEAIASYTPSVNVFGSDVSRINVIYIPATPPAGNTSTFEFFDGFFGRYNYDLSRQIITAICSIRSSDVENVCKSSLSFGPYLFTYAHPIGDTKNLSPPVLFVDLSEINQQAFPTFIDAYKQQLKQDDITDGKKLYTLSMKLLNVILIAKDWISPIRHTVAGLVHFIPKDETNESFH